MAVYVFGLDGAPMLCETPERRAFWLWELGAVERRAWRAAHGCVRAVCAPDAPVQSVLEAFEMGYVLMVALDPATAVADMNKQGGQ
jgi:hypothetical protein